ncbi:MAG: hypothetical protein NTV86_24000 [Planctomycetota bacterium]|nr:hypothetical protein [Planctomycetota bacterium]
MNMRTCACVMAALAVGGLAVGCSSHTSSYRPADTWSGRAGRRRRRRAAGCSAAPAASAGARGGAPARGARAAECRA